MSSTLRRGAHPVSDRIRVRSGTRRCMSSKPTSYASSYGIRTIRDEEPVRSTIADASAPIVVSFIAPTLKTWPTASGWSSSSISASTVSCT
jgi:hypothetical protein